MFILLFLYIGCATANFTIASARYGNVHHYGVYEDLDLLEFAQLPPAYFCFTSNHALLEVKTRKCVGAINSTNLQLILTSNCNEPWTYISDVQELVDTNIGYCFSPWYYPLSPVQVGFVPGLSPCGEWNRMILNPSKYSIYRAFLCNLRRFFVM
jgi:hypothetical protein